MHSSLSDSKAWRVTIRTGDRTHRRNQPIEIEPSVLDTSMVRISQEIVHAICIHLTSNQIPPEHTLLCASATLYHCCDVVGPESIIRIERMLLYGFAEFHFYCSNGIVFVYIPLSVFLLWEKILRSVRKWSMAHIVQKGSETNQLAVTLKPRVVVSEFRSQDWFRSSSN